MWQYDVTVLKGCSHECDMNCDFLFSSVEALVFDGLIEKSYDFTVFGSHLIG